jgi:ketosteroid isomerase-like protein
MAEPSPSQLINDWVTAAKSKNLTALGSLYTSDAVLCVTPPPPPDINIGGSAIINYFQESFGAGWVLTDVTTLATTPGTDPNWAWAYGHWNGTVTQNSKVTQLSGCWSMLCVNQPPPAGNWLILQQTIVTE